MKQACLSNLLATVARRLRLLSLVDRLWRFWLAIAGVVAIVLLGSRSLGLLPPWITLPSLAGLPVAALLLAVLFHHRPTRAEAARLVDTRMTTRDLFLTAALIESSLGAYQELVLDQAERRANEIRPAQVAPWRWQRTSAAALAALAALVLATAYLPAWDPFGRQQQRRQVTQQRERLRETRQAAQMRLALLEQKPSELSAQRLEQAVTELKQTFHATKPDDKQGNFTRLNEQQKKFGELWKQSNEEKLRDALQKSASTPQSLGGHDPAKARQWKEDLQKGDAASVSKEVAELKDLARQLAAASDPARKEALRQEMMNRMRDLQEALAQSMRSQPLDAALQRALEQLQMANREGLSQEALQALGESLQLTAAELQQLAAAAKNMMSLEDALKALQAAKRLNGMKPMDGKACRPCENPAEYAAMFNAMYAAACQGGQGGMPAGQIPGSGSGLGPGQGVGPRPHGDESATTAYKQQTDPSQFQPGQTLLSWKTREVSEAGPAREEFRQSIEAVRREASEAILREQVPEPYHATIKSYFDSLHNEPAPVAQP